jgi:hypothetical protein
LWSLNFDPVGPEPTNSKTKLGGKIKMESLVYNTDGNVFNTFGLKKQPVSTSFNRFNKRVSSRFTQVTAVGQIREYSRLELLHSIFNLGDGKNGF